MWLCSFRGCGKAHGLLNFQVQQTGWLLQNSRVLSFAPIAIFQFTLDPYQCVDAADIRSLSHGMPKTARIQDSHCSAGGEVGEASNPKIMSNVCCEACCLDCSHFTQIPSQQMSLNFSPQTAVFITTSDFQWSFRVTDRDRENDFQIPI